jgi:hypothetical protein
MTGRGALALGAAAAAVLVVVLALGRGAPPAPGGPASSSYATQPAGLAAYAALLQRAGHDVRRIRAPLDVRRPSPAETVVLADGRPLPRPERVALARFVRAGGQVVLAGPAAARAVPAGLGGPRVRRLRETAPLSNAALARGANAARALALAGPPARRVAFVESVHGFHERRGLGALPVRVRWCLWLAALAAAVLLVARGRRLGPPEATARELPPPRRAHVEALAAALARTKDRDTLLETTTTTEAT